MLVVSVPSQLGWVTSMKVYCASSTDSVRLLDVILETDMLVVYVMDRYGCSKWACEVLLKQLHERWGVPVKIFRCGMILSHTQYLGQINPTDFFTRLLCGIAYTGIAPESFYTLPHGPEEHFDGMPIDFVSGAALSPICHLRDVPC